LKIFWNNFVTPKTFSKLRQSLLKHIPLKDINMNLPWLETLFYYIIVVFNNIATPLFVTFVVNPSCFYYAIFSAPPITSEYATKSFCDIYVTFYLFDYPYHLYRCNPGETISRSYDGPFLYNYQCSLGVLQSYAGAYVYLFAISSFVLPLILIALKALEKRTSLYLKDNDARYWNELHSFIVAILPPILKPSTIHFHALRAMSMKFMKRNSSTSPKTSEISFLPTDHTVYSRVVNNESIASGNKVDKKEVESKSDLERIDENKNALEIDDGIQKFEVENNDHSVSREITVRSIDAAHFDSMLLGREVSINEGSAVNFRDNDAIQHVRSRIFNNSGFISDVLFGLCILVSFGVVFPPMAVVVYLALMSHTYLNQYLIGSFVEEAEAQSHYGCIESVQADCDEVIKLLEHIGLLLIPFACLFHAFFVFDILGDETGWLRALWAPIILAWFPFCAWFGVKVFLLCTQNDVKKNDAQYEMGERQVSVSVYASEDGAVNYTE
jgi:hypothetical protein